MKIFLIFLFLFAQLQSVQAIIWDKRFSLKEDTNQIKVFIVDEATDGCWTNLLESKKYVEDKLQLLGVNINNETDFVPVENLKTYAFSIYVQASRNGGFCIGSIFLSLHTYSDVNGRLHLATIYTLVGTGTQNKNLNNTVLARISDAFKELK